MSVHQHEAPHYAAANVARHSDLGLLDDRDVWRRISKAVDLMLVPAPLGRTLLN